MIKKIIFISFFPLVLFSNPKEATIIQGNVAISETDNKLIINQTTDKSIIHWQSFSIAENEKTIFNQPSGMSSTLNRVIGNDISRIYGTLESNGKLFLINQKGILIGPSGIINTNGFLLSTLDLKDNEFLEGKDLNFETNSDSKIENFGIINGLDKDIIIISPTIKNEGRIQATNDKVSLLSSSNVLLKEDGTNSVVRTNVSLVENKGMIEAVQVELKAANNNIYSLAINQEGIIKTNGIENKDGRIILSADSGAVSVKGTLKSSSKDNGGKIQIFGDYVNVKEGAQIDATSEKDGGTVLIGGDYKGKNENIKNSKLVYIEKGSLIDASSTVNGKGGRVILWSDEGTWFHGCIRARGGHIAGDGGFVEISSSGILDPIGEVSTKASCGKVGSLLLDPTDVTISSGADVNISSPIAPPPPPAGSGPYSYVFSGAAAVINTASLQTFLNDGDVTINTNNAFGNNGVITILASVTWSAATRLSLIADAYIKVTNSSTISNTALSGTYSLFTDVFGRTHTGVAISLEGQQAFGTNHGVLLDTGTQLSTSYAGSPGGGGNVYLYGKGPNVGGFYGIGLGPSTITTLNGNIYLEGQGGSGGIQHIGVLLFTAILQSTGSGSITLNGTGGNGVNICYGIAGVVSSRIATNAGTLTINGTGGATGTSNHGVIFSNMNFFPPNPTGPIMITGTGGGTSGDGFNISNVNIKTSGPINITATGVGSGNGMTLVSSTIQGTDNQAITLTLDAPGAGLDFSQAGGIIQNSTGNIIVYNNTYNSYSATTFQTSGGLSIYPKLTTNTIGIGNPLGNNLTINNTTLSNISTNVNSVTIGNPIGSHAVQIGGITTALTKPLTVNGNTISTVGNINFGNQTVNFNIGRAGLGSFTLNNYTYSNIGTNVNINGGAFTNTLIGPNIDTVWNITNPNTGTINPNGAGLINFNTIQNLQGGTENDTYIFNAGGSVSNINGGGGNNTIVGPDLNLIWYITGMNKGYIPGIVSSFENIQNLTGGSQNDYFKLSDQAGLTGTLNGGGGFNTLDFSAYTTPFEEDLDIGFATNFGLVLNIQKLVSNEVILDERYFTLLDTTYLLNSIHLDKYDYMFDNQKKFFIRLNEILCKKIFKSQLISPILK